jgi:hypothetical protein
MTEYVALINQLSSRDHRVEVVCDDPEAVTAIDVLRSGRMRLVFPGFTPALNVDIELDDDGLVLSLVDQSKWCGTAMLFGKGLVHGKEVACTAVVDARTLVGVGHCREISVY